VVEQIGVTMFDNLANTGLAATPQFRKSSFSEGGGDCVEVAKIPSRVVRDSKDPYGPSLYFFESEWAAFVKGVKAGEFD
jgi:hypothetical protein